MEKRCGIFGGRRLKKTLWAGVLLLALSVALPGTARAVCETRTPSNNAIADLVEQDIAAINLFITQEKNFIDSILNTEAFGEVTGRLNDLSSSARSWWERWWKNDFGVALKDMTAELHTAQVDQSRNLGMLADASLLVEEDNRRTDAVIDARRRYAPSGLACEIDTIGLGQARADQVSRKLTHTLAMEDVPRRNNDKMAVSAVGPISELRTTWEEYIAKFCDRSMADQACTQILPAFPRPSEGTLAGRHKDIPALLWGNRQTIDPSNADNLLVMQAALRYMIYPLVSHPVARTAVETAPGHQQLLWRRAETAYANTIYNTMGRMMSERIGGSGVNAQALRAAAGIPPADASTNASYRELQEAMTRDRALNPSYIVRMIEDPAQVAREQGTLNALRLQAMSDIYRRSEEMLFMEAAAYSRDLNQQMPPTAQGAGKLGN